MWVEILALPLLSKTTLGMLFLGFSLMCLICKVEILISSLGVFREKGWLVVCMAFLEGCLGQVRT